MVDSSDTGRLRDEFGILPPGDILKCIVALSPHREVARILLKRCGGPPPQGHNTGNMLLTMLSLCREFPGRNPGLAEILDVRDRILPMTVDQATLVAELTDGTHLRREAIDVPRGTQRENTGCVPGSPPQRIHIGLPAIDQAAAGGLHHPRARRPIHQHIPGLIVPGRGGVQKSSAKLCS
jgi:uncharacterized cofD-like protein